MGDKLTPKEFAALHGITLRTVRNWIKQGLPSKKGKINGQANANIIDINKAAKWLADQNKITPYMKKRAAASIKGKPGDKQTVRRIARKTAAEKEKYFDPARAKADIDGDLLTRYGLEGALERARFLEARIFETLMDFIDEEKKNKKKKENPAVVAARHASIAALQALHTKITPVLRDLEMNYLEFQQKKGVLLDSREVGPLWAAIAIGTKEMVMGIGNKVAPFLRQYLAKQKDINKVKDVIDKACRETLKALDENKLPIKGDEYVAVK